MIFMVRTLKVFIIVITFLLLFTYSTNGLWSISNISTANLDTREVLNAESVIDKNTESKEPVGNSVFTVRKPNEAGKIIVVAFHKFVETFTPSKTDDGSFTTTIKDFRKLLETLYDKGYRLVNLNDYMNNNISVPHGCIPIVFTFDDGSQGQFNLVKVKGKLQVNKNTAVGVMEDFNKEHPDFGLKGTFYVNLGLDTFKGEGSLSQRLKYLIDKGFEIGNHTLTHINLKKEKDAGKIIKEIGGEQKLMYKLVPGYTMHSLALPYGQCEKVLSDCIIKGEYEGVKYENKAVMKIAWDPMFSPNDNDYDPLEFKRVLASCIKPYPGDLAWWIKSFPLNEQYVSDGNMDTVTIPSDCLSKISVDKLKDKRLIVN